MRFSMLFRDFCRGLDKSHWQGTIYIVESNNSLSAINDYKGSKYITKGRAGVDDLNTYLLYQHHFVENYLFVMDERAFKTTLFIRLFTDSNFTKNSKATTFVDAFYKVEEENIHTIKISTHRDDETNKTTELTYNKGTYQLFTILGLCPISNTLKDVEHTGVIQLAAL